MIHESRLLAVKALWNRLNGSEKSSCEGLAGTGRRFRSTSRLFCVIYVAQRIISFLCLDELRGRMGK